jgi:hypothetical protein
MTSMSSFTVSHGPSEATSLAFLICGRVYSDDRIPGFTMIGG